MKNEKVKKTTKSIRDAWNISMCEDNEFIGYTNGSMSKSECCEVNLNRLMKIRMPVSRNGFIHTGFHPQYPYQLVIIDFDPIDAIKNTDTILIPSNYSELLPIDTKTQQSGSGGLHFFYFVDSTNVIPSSQNIVNHIGNVSHIDVRGSYNGKLIAAGSKFNEHKHNYRLINEYHIKVLSFEEWEQIKENLHLDYRVYNEYLSSIPQTGEWMQCDREMRNGFLKILYGDIDLHNILPNPQIQEFLYWKAFWREALCCGYSEEELFNILEANQPAFSRAETIQQLKYIVHRTPPSIEHYNELFPNEDESEASESRDVVINGNKVSRREFFKVFGIILNADNSIKQWNEVCYVKNEREWGMKAHEHYCVMRMFLQSLEHGYTKIIFDDKTQRFFERDEINVWKVKTEKQIHSKIDRICNLYLGSSIVNKKIIENTLEKFKTFYPVEEMVQNPNLITYEDCALIRYDLFQNRISIHEILPEDFVTSYIPHRVKEIFESIGETFNLDELWTHPHTWESPFYRFIDRIWPNELHKKLMFAFFADIIDTAKPEQWVFFFPSRFEGTGKGTLANICKSIVGNDGKCGVTEQLLKNDHGLAVIENKRLYILPETQKEAFRTTLNIIKMLSGGDTIPVNPKNEKPRDVEALGVLFISTNDTPSIPTTERAIARRFVIMQMSISNPFAEDEYEIIKQEINESIAQLVAFSTLFIPLKKQLHRQYKGEHDVLAEYSKETEDPEWEFFELALQEGNERDGVYIHDLFARYQMYCEVYGYVFTDNKEGFAKMFNKFIRDKKWKCNLHRKRKTINGETKRLTGYDKIKLNYEMMDQLFEEYNIKEIRSDA